MSTSSTAKPLAHNQVAFVNVDLNYSVPRRNNDGTLGKGNILRIMESSSYDDGGYAPAESITIAGEAITTLRDFINKEFPTVPENPDIVEMFKEQPNMVLTFSYALAPGEVVHGAEEIRGIVNHFGKVFYDRGYAVESEVERIGGMDSVLKVIVRHKS